MFATCHTGEAVDEPASKSASFSPANIVSPPYTSQKVFASEKARFICK